MKRALLLFCGVVSCGSPFKEPVLEERKAPSMGQPPHKVLPKYVPDAGVVTLPDAGCCAVRFAFPAGSEVAVDLFGFGEPLPFEGVPLWNDGGVWETTVCMGPTQMLYAYRLYLRPDVGDAGLFPLVSYNPNVLTVMSPQYGLLNEFDARDAGSCADFATTLHADAKRPDAGVLIYPDGGDDAGAGSDGG